MVNLKWQGSGGWTIICRSDMEAEILRNAYAHVLVTGETEGAACTILTAKDLIDTDAELLVANCDQLVFQPRYMDNALAYWRRTADAGILCCIKNEPYWSYVGLGPGGEINEVAEKQVISNLATVGVYWWRRGSDFVRAAERMIQADDRFRGEFYLAPTYNYLITEGKIILPFVVNDVWSIGTPELLETYNERKYRRLEELGQDTPGDAQAMAGS